MKVMSIAFEDPTIRRVYDEDTQTWWFSVVDVVQVLTQQSDCQTAHKHWCKLKARLSKEGSESVTNCRRLKLLAADGKQRLTDVATAETLLRLAQSISNPKAESIKLWQARVGYERMQEALFLDHARQAWCQPGHSDEWIGKHQVMKGMSSLNLCNDTSEAELIFAALAELSTRQIAESMEATGMVENKCAAEKGGRIAAQAQCQLESQTGKSFVSGDALLPTKPNVCSRVNMLQVGR